MNDTVLVTGVAGFIGFHLATALMDKGVRVIGCDNLCAYYPVSLKHRRLQALAEKAGDFVFVEADLCDDAALEAIFQQWRPSRVCNLAAQAGVRHSILNPKAYQKSNLEGFLNILECCRYGEVERLVYASSSSVYGGNTNLPFAETDRVETPISLYAATKRANELMAHCYTHLYGLPTVGLRFFTVYGPWGRPDMAMWIFAEKIIAGEPIPVFNQGRMQRDFTYVDDIVSGVIASLFSSELAPFELFNLGNHRMEKLLDMIGLIETALGCKAELNMLPIQPGDVPASYADISRAQKKLDFLPRTPLAEGIPQFCSWYQAHPEIASEVRAWRQRQDSLSKATPGAGK